MDGNSKTRSNQDGKNKSLTFSCFFLFIIFIGNKLTMESEMPERRRDSSIKKILSNQPLEKQEYVGKKFNKFQYDLNIIYIEINQKVQNSTVGASKVHSSNDINGLERANSTGARECMIKKQNN